MPASKLKPVVSTRWIMTSLRYVIDPAGRRIILWDAPISRYIRGGRPAVRAFHNILNRSPNFKGYNISLTPGDLNDVKSVSDIGVVIIDWFRSERYRIVI
jgi:hypothetical protein